jgi:hypothetical protein
MSPKIKEDVPTLSHMQTNRQYICRAVTTVVVTDQEVVVTDPEMDLVVVDRP